MTSNLSPWLAAWQNFYLILGSSASALIGIQFVVITLVANMRHPASAESISAFATPTVVQLASALILSVLVNVPWGSLGILSLALSSCGVLGMAYCLRVIRRAHRQTDYMPEREDWFWYALLPLAAYLIQFGSALALPLSPRGALFGLGGASLALLLIGIHNAWDSVTHIVISQRPSGGKP